jgi:hypothetical protein
MILTHESGAQEDQFDGKKEGQKSRGTIPLNSTTRFSTSIFSHQTDPPGTLIHGLTSFG